jgi:transposase
MVRPVKDLDSFKDKIINWFQDGITIDAIVERLDQQFQVQLSVSTMKRRLRKWGI